ncbi:MAG: hypothetical protein QNK30_16250 [Bacteroidales bacterium]|nr:hypothetical protein [Bacteroidales bacterium]
MKSELLILLFVLNLFSVFGQDMEEKSARFINIPGLYYNYESGVSSRLSVQDIAKFKVANKHLLSAALRIHLNQQSGFGSLHLAAEELKTPLPWLYFSAELAHHEYRDYNIGENQLAVLAFFLPFKKIKFGIGYTYRSVSIKDSDFHSMFDWQNEMDEGYLIFQFKWLIYQGDKWNLAFNMGTYDFMRIQTKDHVFLELEQMYNIKENIDIQLNISTAVKGISGLVLAVNEFQIETGLRFSF